MILKEIQHIFHQELDAIYGIDEVDCFFDMLLNAYLGFSRIDMVLSPKLTITKTEEQPLFEALSRLKLEEPIQYIIGSTEFYGLKLKVNQHTLIPRPETEELVDWIIRELKNKDSKTTILDIGTGSGCIAIALAKNLPKTKVQAIDISEEALKVAKENAEINNVEVEFIEKDILSETLTPVDSSSQGLDIIVSNPPYVRNLEKSEIKNNVLIYEPHLALFVQDEDPLLFYKAISLFAVNNLHTDGQLFFEINQYLGKEMILLLETYGFTNIELKKDLFGNQRMIKATKK